MVDFRKRRAFPRRKAAITLSVSSVTSRLQTRRDCSKEPFVCRDIGAGGLGVETHFALELGDMLDVSFSIPGSAKIIQVQAVVRNVQVDHHSQRTVWRAGLEFLRISAEDRKALAEYSKDMGFII